VSRSDRCGGRWHLLTTLAPPHDAGTSSRRWHLLTTHIQYLYTQRAVAVTLPKFPVDTTVEDKLSEEVAPAIGDLGAQTSDHLT